MINVTYYSKQHGFTLTEFLIAGFLGSLLILGMTHLISSSWLALRYQTNLTYHEEAAQAFFATIEQDLESARFSGTFPINWAASANTSRSDRLSLSYKSSVKNNNNCLGDQITGTIINTYYIRPASDSPFKTDDMMCVSNNRSDTVAQHIELMKVRYAIDKGQFVHGTFINQPDGLADSWTTNPNEAQQYKIISIDIVIITKSWFRDKTIPAPPKHIWNSPLGNFGIDIQDGYLRLLHTQRFNLTPDG